MNETMTGQFIPRDSLLHRLGAGCKLICFLLILVCVAKRRAVRARSCVGGAVRRAFQVAACRGAVVALAHSLVFADRLFNERAVFWRQ